jgi:peptidyl-prolyl cis-trans isomerase C
MYKNALFFAVAFAASAVCAAIAPSSYTAPQGQNNAEPSAPVFSAVTVDKTSIPASLQKTLYQSARTTVPQSISNAQVAEQVKMNLIRQAVLKNEAARLGLDKKQEIVERLALTHDEVLAKAAIEEFLKKNPIKDEEVKAAYDREKAAYGDSEYQLRNILIKDEAKVKAVLDELASGREFGKVAALSSADDKTASKGGLNNFVALPTLAPELRDTVKSLKQGEYTKNAVKTPLGYQIIYLETVRPAELFPDFEKAKPRLREILALEKSMKYTEELVKKAKIK